MKGSARLRAARKSDALELACLIDSASRGLALWSWRRLSAPGQSAIEVGRTRVGNNEASPLHYKAWTVAEIGGAVAGAVAGRLIPVPYERGDASELDGVFAPLLELEAVAAGSWFLNSIAVHSEFRGQGVGSLLLDAARERALAAGASQMSIIVEEGNVGALKLYVRHGFSDWARRRYIPFPGSTDEGDWLLLRKELPR